MAKRRQTIERAARKRKAARRANAARKQHQRETKTPRKAPSRATS